MNSFISWIGGKRLLRNKIIEQFPDSYSRYVEVFGGAGWVLFAHRKRLDLEVYNDVNGDLVNLFRVVKYHPETLQKELDWLLISREVFFDSIQNITGLTDIQRAARFWIVIKESFGTDCRSFGAGKKNLPNAIEYLREVSSRLQSVVIENRDFEQLIKTYDRAETLFYLDPPYYDAEQYYAASFSLEDHKRLKQALNGLKGKFLLSYNDCEAIRELYSGYEILELDRQKCLATKSGAKRYQELLIKNY